MKTIFSLLLIIVVSASCTAAAAAQESPRIPRIGLLTSGSVRVVRPNHNSFLRGLEELGYVDGKNIALEYRYANGNRKLLPTLVADFIRLNVSVIVPSGPTATRPAIKATKTIPIVMPNGGDPVRYGFVNSLVRPGGNVTGVSGHIDDLEKKQIELLKETAPSITRVVVLNPHTEKEFIAGYEEVAAVLGLDLQTVDFYKPENFDGALARITTMRPDALITTQRTQTLRYASQIADFAVKNRLPLMTNDSRFVDAGALMSLGVNYPGNWRRAAVFVDKILKGANPATLPVEPPQIKLVVNLKTAERIGVTIPPEILLEANEVIK